MIGRRKVVVYSYSTRAVQKQRVSRDSELRVRAFGNWCSWKINDLFNSGDHTQSQV